MKQNRTVFIPAIAVAVIAVLLVIYSFYAMQNGQHPQLPEGGQLPPRDEKTNPFLTLGTIALVCGAISFSWLRFKNKLTSPSQPIKRLAKLLYKVHTYTGWIACLLILAHGTYFMITKFQDNKIYTGLAAFLILAALAVYGWLIKRVRNKDMRRIHFLLSNLWLVVLLLHAGGSFIMTVAVTLLFWAIIWFMELRSKRRNSMP
jgi:hypothetical protein